MFEPQEESPSLKEEVINSFQPQVAMNIHDRMTIREARRIASERIRERVRIRVQQLLALSSRANN